MFLVLSSFVMTYFAHYGNSKFYSTSLTMITSVVVSLHFIFRWNKGNASPTILDLFDLFIDVLGIFITWLMGHIILLRYYPMYGTAYVMILKGLDLMSSSKSNFPTHHIDTYVNVRLNNDYVGTTAKIWKTEQPEFNHQFSFPIKIFELMKIMFDYYLHKREHILF